MYGFVEQFEDEDLDEDQELEDEPEGRFVLDDANPVPDTVTEFVLGYALAYARSAGGRKKFR